MTGLNRQTISAGKISGPADVAEALKAATKVKEWKYQTIKLMNPQMTAWLCVQHGLWIRAARTSSEDGLTALRQAVSFQQGVYAVIGSNELLPEVQNSEEIGVDLRALILEMQDFSQRLAQSPQAPAVDDATLLDQALSSTISSFQSMAAALEQVVSSKQDVLGGLQVGVIICHNDLRIDYLNKRAEEIVSQKTAELSGKQVQTLLQSWSAETQVDLVKQVGRTIPEKYWLVCDSKPKVPVEIVVSRLEMQEGERVVLNVQDISERFKVEQFKKELVGMVGHELRSPLTAVGSFLRLIADGTYDTSDRLKQRASMSVGNIDRLIKLINELLSLESIEAGKFQLALRPSNVMHVMESAVNSVSGLAESQGIQIVVHPTDLVAVVDPDRLVQVLVNFIGNAIKFSPQGSTIELWARYSSSDFSVYVRDHGRGVSPEAREKIFQKYEQVSAEDKQAMSGVGLGLAISKAIVDGHGGSLGVDPAPGQGSIFWFTIPLAVEVKSQS